MNEIIAQYGGKVRAVIKKLTGAYNEDIEQEVYIKTWKNLPAYREEGKFGQWICQLAANVCRDYFRSRQYKQSAAEVGGDVLDGATVRSNPEQVLSAKSRQKIILHAVDDLPAKLRKIVIWYEFEDLSYDQIAAKTGLPLGTVKSRLFAARKILAEQLKFLKGE